MDSQPEAPLRSPSVYVSHTGTSKGRGVFAARSHAEGETVELCPVVLFDASFAGVPDEVRKLLFNWGVLADMRSTHCLALGYGSMYNHDNPANMRYEADTALNVLRFVAVRAIAPHEELTVNYNAIGGAHESADDSWFERMGITPFVAG
jgi:SET domain